MYKMVEICSNVSFMAHMVQPLNVGNTLNVYLMWLPYEHKHKRAQHAYTFVEYISQTKNVQKQVA